MVSSSALVKLKIDDPLDAFPVHGVCGFWGVIAVGFFAKQRFVEDVIGRPASDYGVIYGVSVSASCDVAFDLTVDFVLFDRLAGDSWVSKCWRQ